MFIFFFLLIIINIGLV